MTNLSERVMITKLTPEQAAELPAFRAPDPRIAALTAEVARKDEALWAALGELYAPEANCSCHISPPCSDCVEYSSIRSTQDLIRAALEARND